VRNAAQARDTIHIATAIDEGYLLPLKVMLASLTQNVNPTCRPVVHVLNRALTGEQIESIGAIADTRSVIIDEDAVSRLPNQSSFLAETAFPLLLASVLPDTIDRVLFLDPDLLILDDVTQIWETELDGNVIGAVTDAAIPLCSSPRGVKDIDRYGIPADAPYFNAGVMLIDLARWREKDVSRRAGEYLAGNRRADFYHQEALNAVLHDDWLSLESRWNLIASLTGRRRVTDESSPGIVHFAGYFKPWKLRVGGPYAKRYREIASRFGDDGSFNAMSTSQRIFSFYDAHLRDHLYGIERALWNRRLI
jgi:lipopolysaccharide biosynthesis glycosyltransferase